MLGKSRWKKARSGKTRREKLEVGGPGLSSQLPKTAGQIEIRMRDNSQSSAQKQGQITRKTVRSKQGGIERKQDNEEGARSCSRGPLSRSGIALQRPELSCQSVQSEQSACVLLCPSD